MGMLNQQPPQAQQAPQPVASPQGQSAPVSAQQLQKHVNNIVKVAHVYMYSNQTKEEYISSLKKAMKQYPPQLAAAHTAIDTIFLLIQQSQFKMMQQAVVPAGIMIAGEILDFIAQSTKHKVTEKESSDTIAAFIQLIQERIGNIVAKNKQGQQAPQQPQPAMQGA